MARKPDLFEQMIDACTQDASLFVNAIDPMDALKLLRRYHARVRRMVKNAPVVCQHIMVHHDDRLIGQKRLLEALDNLKKRG